MMNWRYVIVFLLLFYFNLTWRSQMGAARAYRNGLCDSEQSVGCHTGTLKQSMWLGAVSRMPYGNIEAVYVTWRGQADAI